MTRAARLGLGTGQWGMAYGIANSSGPTTTIEVANLLGTAKRHGITLVDTARAYGEAEKVLGEHGAASQAFLVVTKTLPLRDARGITEQAAASVAAAFRESLRWLKCDRVYGLLVHHGDTLLLPGGDRLWALLQDLKTQRRVQKIGVSVYQPVELELILERYPLDLVQLPLNLYDQRFLQQGLLSRLRKVDIEIHARSAFLQGLLLLPPTRLPGHFRRMHNHHARLYHRVREAGLTPLEASLGFCLGQADVDRVIVGCECGQQLDEIIAAAGKDDVLLPGPELYSIDDESIINPARWPK